MHAQISGQMIHVAQGDSASGGLRAACASSSLPGEVLNITDDLSHGPLDDGRTRADYLTALYCAVDAEAPGVTDAFAPWHALADRLAADPSRVVVVWGGHNVADDTLLALTCWWLRDRPGCVMRVAVPGGDGRHNVPMYDPTELAKLYDLCEEIPRAEREWLAQDFLRIRAETGTLRRWQSGRIVGVPADRYDPLLIECCTVDWMPAARVVGKALGRCDEHNLMSDLFFDGRLRVLVDQGRIETDASGHRLNEFSVRLPLTRTGDMQ